MPDDQSQSLPPTQSASLEAGQRVFRHYVLHRFLGRGALGAAWLVVHEGHGRELAMRFVPEAWLRDERVMSALRDAVVKLLDITHPNLVGVLDFVRDQVAAAIVARFVEGRTLSDLRTNAEERFLPVAMIQEWAARLCDSLDFAWSRHNAIHGDLCPQNLLLTEAEEFRVLDFGLARSLYDVPGPTGAPLLTGTQAYMSPERARGMSVTAADDVYGFGATFYELLTSRPVFFRGNLLWQLESVVPPTMAERRTEFGISGDPIPPEWEEVIAACLAKRREDRPRDMREVGERLGLLSKKTNSTPAPAPAPAPIVLPKVTEFSTQAVIPPPRPSSPAQEISSSFQTVGMESDTHGGDMDDLEVTREAHPTESPTVSTQDAPPAGDDADQTVAAVEPPPPTPPPAIPPPPPTEVPVSIEKPVTTPPPPLPVPAPEKPAVAVPPPMAPPAPKPAAAPAPPPVAPAPAPQPATPASPAKSPLIWIAPAALGALALGIAAYFLIPKKTPQTPVAPTPTPIPATPLAATPTPVPTTPKPTPVPPAPARGREVTVAELIPMATQELPKETLLLTGEFRVSSAFDRDVVARPTAKELSGKVRVTARIPQGATLPAEGSVVQWNADSGWIVRGLRRGNDGQININVEKSPKP